MQSDLFEATKPTEYEVVWCKSWEGQPIVKPSECDHSGPDALPINLRIEPAKKGGGNVIVTEGQICMACGTDSTRQLSLVDGLKRCMDEYGFRRVVVERLYELAEYHEEYLRDVCCPIWMWSAFGLTGKEIVDRLNSGELVECGK